MITCTRRIEFDAAHRIMYHESKCKHVHGHRYVAEVTFAIDERDTMGRVIDFGVIKDRLGEWINTHWDHTLILSAEDKKLGDDVEVITGQTVFYMKAQPTAENMADYLLQSVCPGLFSDIDGLQCSRVRLYETPNCYADAIR